MHTRSHYFRIHRIALGFTLIELMIVVAIVAILAAIAFPSYDEYVRRGRRAELQTQILQAGQFMDRYFTSNNSTYAASVLPVGLASSPDNSSVANRLYDIALTNVTANTYTLTGTRTAGKGMETDACGDFTLLHTGEKNLANNTKPVAECWRR